MSNGIGAVSGLVQLILYGIYYRTTPKDDDVKASEVQMSGTNAASSRV